MWPSDIEKHLKAIDDRLDDHHRHLRQILTNQETIMTAISDFTAKMTTFFDRQDKAVSDLQDDVKNLTDEIAKLQASPGQITPEYQASLDAIQARASTVADKLDALDALTPPLPPAPAG